MLTDEQLTIGCIICRMLVQASLSLSAIADLLDETQHSMENDKPSSLLYLWASLCMNREISWSEREKRLCFPAASYTSQCWFLSGNWNHNRSSSLNTVLTTTIDSCGKRHPIESKHLDQSPIQKIGKMDYVANICPVPNLMKIAPVGLRGNTWNMGWFVIFFYRHFFLDHLQMLVW